MHKDPEFPDPEFNDPLERNMKHLFSPTDLPDDEAVPRLSASEREEMAAGVLRHAKAKSARPAKPVAGRWFVFWAALLGVILPALTIVVELSTRICTNTIFDPIPTIWHILLCSAVPVVNLGLLLGLKDKFAMPSRLRAGLVGFSLGVSLFFMVTFARILPAALMGSVFILIGVGIIAWFALSPYIGAIYAGVLSFRFRRKERAAGLTPRPAYGIFATGFALGLAAILGAAAIHYDRVNALEKAVATAGPIPAETLISLDNKLSEPWLRNAVKRSPTKMPGIDRNPFDGGYVGYGWGAAHQAYYQLYGKSVDSRYRRPRSVHTVHHDYIPQWIGRTLPSLRLTTSEMSGWVDPDAGLGYIEWTQELINYDNEADEGRQHIQLPPGGVVSRVTLWVNGEPREAAFDTIAKTRAAYEYIVKRKRDPVLVNHLGGDKVQIECYPVPAKAADGTPGKMKYRVGISFPLDPATETSTDLVLPRMLSRNFVLVSDFEHVVALDTAGEIPGFERVGVSRQSAKFPVKPAVAEGRSWRVAEDPEVRLPLVRDAAVREAVCIDPVAGGPVVSRLVERPPVELRRVAVVVDTSAPMRSKVDKIRKAVAVEMPEGPTVRWFPDDLETQTFVGGPDAEPNLHAAVAWAAEEGNGLVLWFHGPQPLSLSDGKKLTRLLSLREDDMTLHAIEAVPGANWLRDRYIEPTHQYKSGHSYETRLATAFDSVNAREGELVWERTRAAKGDPLPERKAMDDLAKLVAYGEIMEGLTEADDDAVRKEISDKAVAYKLVTPVSAAIVLESREEYLQHGLKPPEDEAAGMAGGGVVPEPNTLLMLLLGGGLMGLLQWRRRVKGEG